MALNDTKKASIFAAGGISTILAAMGTHSSNANVQQYGCGALRNLAVNDYFSVSITTAGGITAILSAMTTHWYNANV